MKKLIALLAVVGLTACGDPESTLKIGSKDFSESKILSEMIAALAEAEGIPVTRRIGLGPTRTNLEALKRGDIDLYPEYNGTGLVMLGQPALTDGDAAMDRVRSLYEPLNLAWGKRFGFANNYGLAMRKARAEELGVSKISDLVGQAGDLTIGIDANFQSRPLDGFQPMTARYGMSFGDVETVPPEERTSLYDRLLRGEADVIEVFTTDGQIADLGLVLLEDDLDFFPVYQAAPLVRTEALVEFSALRDTLNKLAGALDAETMQALNSQVDQASRAPRDVARAALADLGLLDTSGDFEVDEPLVVSHAPLTAADAEAGRALSAVRQAFPARRVQLVAADDPLAAVGRGEARIGLVAAAEFAEVADGGTTTRPFEAAGVVGQTYLHLIALKGGVASLEDVSTIATGPEGSASHRAGRMLAAGLDGLALEPLGGDGFAEAAAGSGADAALVLAPLDSQLVRDMTADRRLIPLAGWDQGANLIRFPFLREARIPAGTYAGQSEPVGTLSSQLVLAGPVIVKTDAVGPQGPGASAPTEVAELSDETVTALSQALDAGIAIDPAMPTADALTPQLPEPPAPLNPSPPISLLTMVVFALIGWLLWLYGRPERR